LRHFEAFAEALIEATSYQFFMARPLLLNDIKFEGRAGLGAMM